MEKRERKKPTYRYKTHYVERVVSDWDDPATERRWRLDIHLKGDGEKSILVIMMNPSRATGEISDRTINNVIKYIFKNREKYPVLKDTGKIIIANLYTIYETYSTNVTNLINSNGKQFIIGNDADAKFNNDNIIVHAAEEASSIIIGWGKAKIEGYNERIKDVLSGIKDKDLYHVHTLVTGKYPRRVLNNHTP